MSLAGAALVYLASKVPHCFDRARACSACARRWDGCGKELATEQRRGLNAVAAGKSIEIKIKIKIKIKISNQDTRYAKSKSEIQI
eukprot:scaffold6244_cov197-Pinguiococcus_pyrenoidosus.AAC.1